MIVEFHHGAFSNTYEKQANDQGFTFGEDAEWVQDAVNKGMKEAG